MHDRSCVPTPTCMQSTRKQIRGTACVDMYTTCERQHDSSDLHRISAKRKVLNTWGTRPKCWGRQAPGHDPKGIRRGCEGTTNKTRTMTARSRMGSGRGRVRGNGEVDGGGGEGEGGRGEERESDLSLSLSLSCCCCGLRSAVPKAPSPSFSPGNGFVQMTVGA